MDPPSIRGLLCRPRYVRVSLRPFSLSLCKQALRRSCRHRHRMVPSNQDDLYCSKPFQKITSYSSETRLRRDFLKRPFSAQCFGLHSEPQHTSHMRTASTAAPTSYIDLEGGHFYRQACAPDRKKTPFACKTLCFSFLPEVTENCYFLFPTGDHSGEDGRPPTWYLYIVGGAFGGPSSTAGLTACMALAPTPSALPTHQLTPNPAPI